MDTSRRQDGRGPTPRSDLAVPFSARAPLPNTQSMATELLSRVGSGLSTIGNAVKTTGEARRLLRRSRRSRKNNNNTSVYSKQADSLAQMTRCQTTHRQKHRA